jgi:hypothetical protein
MASSEGERLKRLLLPMAEDHELKRLAEDAGFTWDFSLGFAPRWFRGDWQYPEKVRLVLLMAEPSTPNRGEFYSTDGEEWFEKVVTRPSDGFWAINQERTFKKRLKWFVQECGFDLNDHISTWSQVVMSNTFWLTLPEKEKFRRPPRELERYFLNTYLRPMLLSFTNATIVGAGDKADKRLNFIKVSHESIGALSPPGCNFPAVIARQRVIANQIRNSLSGIESAIK